MTTAALARTLPTNRVARDEPADSHPRLCTTRAVRVPSLDELYGTYFNFVWSMARHLGVGDGELDDVVQDIFVVIYERLDTLQQPESLRSWIYGIIRRIVGVHHRTKRTALIRTGTELVEIEVLHSAMVTPQQMAEQSEHSKLLWSLLERLDPPKREVFVAIELEEMTAPEIATAIGVPLNTVYSRLRIARQEVEAALQRHNARTLKRNLPCPE